MKIYHTAARKDYDALMIELDGKWCRWSDGCKLTDRSYWGICKEKTYIIQDGNILTIEDEKDRCEKFYPNIPIIEYKAKQDSVDDKQDNINPNHYIFGGIETIEYLKAKLTPEEYRGFLKGNVLKYVSRESEKNGLEDLKKAKWYLDKLIEVGNDI